VSHEFSIGATKWAVLRGLLAVLILGVSAWGHDLVTKIDLAPPMVQLQAAYAGTEPVAFAKVQVFSPGGAVAFAKGVTDAGGLYRFAPDRSGAWRVVVDDELGHRTESTVTVPEPFTAAGETEAPASRWGRALLGVLLIGGLTGVLYWHRQRQTVSG